MLKSHISKSLLLLCTTLLLASACEKDSSTNPSPSPPDLTLPPTPDQLLAAFAQAYADRDLSAYGDLIDSGYRFRFQSEDSVHFDLPCKHLTASEELQIAANMFSGQGMPGGEAGITDLQFALFEPITPWGDAHDPDFAGSHRCVCVIILQVERAGSTSMEIFGNQEFYAVSHDSVLSGGTVKTYWQLAGQVDLTDSWWKTSPEGADRGTEPLTWGALKALYW